MLTLEEAHHCICKCVAAAVAVSVRYAFGRNWNSLDNFEANSRHSDSALNATVKLMLQPEYLQPKALLFRFGPSLFHFH